MCLNMNIRRSLISNKTNMINFYLLEAVGRGSETQLRLGKTVLLWRWAKTLGIYGVTLYSDKTMEDTIDLNFDLEAFSCG